MGTPVDSRRSQNYALCMESAYLDRVQDLTAIGSTTLHSSTSAWDEKRLLLVAFDGVSVANRRLVGIELELLMRLALAQ